MDDFKLVTSMPEKKRKNLWKLEDWCKANKIKLNEDKSSILPIKQKEGVKHDFTSNSKQFFEATEQKDLGLLRASNLS